MLVPYSKYHVVARPFGSTVPLSVAVVVVTLVAEPVTATGAGGGGEDSVGALAVPELFVATTR